MVQENDTTSKKPDITGSSTASGAKKSSPVADVLTSAFGQELLGFQEHLARDGSTVSLASVLTHHHRAFRAYLEKRNKGALLDDALQTLGKEKLTWHDIKDIRINGSTLLTKSRQLMVDLLDTQTQQHLYTQQVHLLDTQIATHPQLSGGSKAFTTYLRDQGLPTSTQHFGTGEKQNNRDEGYAEQLMEHVKAYIFTHTDEKDAERVLADIAGSLDFSIGEFCDRCSAQGTTIDYTRKDRIVKGGRARGTSGTVTRLGAKKQQKKRQDTLTSVFFPSQETDKDDTEKAGTGGDALQGLVTLGIEQAAIASIDIVEKFEQLVMRDMSFAGIRMTVPAGKGMETYFQYHPDQEKLAKELFMNQRKVGDRIVWVPNDPAHMDTSLRKHLFINYVEWLSSQSDDFRYVRETLQYYDAQSGGIAALNDVQVAIDSYGYPECSYTPQLHDKRLLIDSYVDKQIQQLQDKNYSYILEAYAGAREHPMTNEYKAYIRRAYESFFRDLYDPSKLVVSFPPIQSSPQDAPRSSKIVFRKKDIVFDIDRLDDLQEVSELDNLFTFVYAIDLEKSDPILVQFLAPGQQGLLTSPSTTQAIESTLTDEESETSFTQLYPGHTYAVHKEGVALHDGGLYPQLAPGGDTPDVWKPTLVHFFAHKDADVDEQPIIAIPLDEIHTYTFTRTTTVPLTTSINLTEQDITKIQTAYNATLLQKTDIERQAGTLGWELAGTADTASAQQYIDMFDDIVDTPRGEHVSDTVDEDIHMRGDVVLARSAEVPEKLFAYEQVHAPDTITTKDDIHAWISEGKIFINQDYLEQTFAITLSTDEAGQYLIDDKQASQHPTFTEIAREVVRLRKHELAHRYFHFHGIKDAALGEEVVHHITITDTGGSALSFTQEELCRLAEGAWSYTESLADNPQRDSVSFRMQDGREVVFSLSSLEASIGQVTGDDFSFRKINRLDVDAWQHYQEHPGSFDDLLAARSATDYADEARANKVSLNKADYADASALAERLKQIAEDEYYDDMHIAGKQWSKEIDLDGKTYRFSRTKKADGSFSPLGLVVLEEKEDDDISERATTPTAVTKQLFSPPEVPDDDPGERAPDDELDTPEDKESTHAGFIEEFNKLKGDGSLDVVDIEDINGMLLYFRAGVSQLPGNGTAWVRAKIHYHGGEAYQLEIIDSTESQTNISQMHDIPLTATAMKQLSGKFAGEVYRMRSASNMKEMYEKIVKAGAFEGTHLAAWDSYYIDSTTLEREAEVEQDRSKGPIKYLGRDNGMGSYDFYQIDQGASSVKVKAVSGEYKFEKRMDYTSFFMFMHDKGLRPYNAAEYQHVQKKVDKPGAVGGSWRDSFMSLGSIIAAVKKFPENYKHYMEQQQKFESAKLYARLAGSLPAWDLFYMEDLQADAESELDSSIWQVISQHKDRLGRNEGENSSVHKKQAALRINKEIFQRMGTSSKFRLKAAGYLLYALDQGNMYFRELSHHADSGMWVKALMGEAHQKAFIEKRRKEYERLKNEGREEEEAMAELMNMEIMYIADGTVQSERKHLYGSKFGKAVEAATETETKDYEASKRGINAKSSFYEIFLTVEGGITKMEPGKMVAGLEAMLERMEYPHHYDLANRIIIQMYASGVLTHAVRAGMKGKLKQLGRTFGIPLLLMAKDVNATRRVVQIMDAISKKAGISSTLSEHVGYNVENVHIDNFSGYQKSDLDGSKEDYKHAVHVKRSKKAGERRDDYGRIMIDAINGKNMYYREAMSDTSDKISKNEHDALNYFYTKKMHDGETNIESGYNKDSFRSENAPNFEEGIMNLSPSTFEKIMMKFGGTSGKLSDPTAQKMWKHFKNKVAQMKASISSAKAANNNEVVDIMLDFMIKKFFAYFTKKLSDSEIKQMKQALRDGGKTKIETFKKVRKGQHEDEEITETGKVKMDFMQFIQRRFIDSEGTHGIQEGAVREGIQEYIDFFGENMSTISTAVQTGGTRLTENSGALA